MQDFIRAYQTASKFGLTKQHLAEYLGVIPKTVDRKRQKIKVKLGMTLPSLENDPDNTPIDDMLHNQFDTELNHNHAFLKNIVKDPTKRRFVITSAQMSTPVNEDFLQSILKYCDKQEAQLMVIPYRYTNPTSVWNAANKEEYISPKLLPYMMTEHIELTPKLHVLGDTRIVPTAIQPVHGIDSLTGTASGIVGHSKVQLMTIPTPASDLPKIMASTGTLTVPNYTISKAGKRGEFHHSFSAIIVEVEENGKTFHLRHLHFDGKGFYDLDKYYTKAKVVKSKNIPVLVTGDYHSLFADPKVNDATFNRKDSIVKVLNPKSIVYHDIHDGYARNTHHYKNDVITYGKHHFGRNNVEEELQVTADLLDSFNHPSRKNIIVKSNHDEQLDRFLADSDPKTDPENTRFYHYMKYHQLCSIEMTDTGFSSFDPFEFWCNNPETYSGLKCAKNTVFLNRTDMYTYEGIIMSFHGDKGSNGARGSAKGFAKIGSKVIIGHSHSPQIYEGVYQCGLSCKTNLEYATGQPSSWLQSHCLVYPNGKRTLINIINGEWKI